MHPIEGEKEAVITISASQEPLSEAPPTNGVLGPRLILLDGFLLDGIPTGYLPPARAQRLLALLALRGPTPRSTVGGLLWPDAPEARAQGSLRTTLWQLGAVGVPLVAVRGDRVSLAADLPVDAEVFSRAAREILSGATGTNIDPSALLALGGELLPGWYDDWVLVERERLRQLRLHALEAAATGLCANGRYAAAIDTALEAVRLEPLRESPHHILVRVHLCEGNVVEAARHLTAFRRLLWAELGVEPSPRLLALIPRPGSVRAS